MKRIFYERMFHEWTKWFADNHQQNDFFITIDQYEIEHILGLTCLSVIRIVYLAMMIYSFLSDQSIWTHTLGFKFTLWKKNVCLNTTKWNKIFRNWSELWSDGEYHKLNGYNNNVNCKHHCDSPSSVLSISGCHRYFFL